MDGEKDLTYVERELRSLFQACTGMPCPERAMPILLSADFAIASSSGLRAPRWLLESPFWLRLFEPLPGRSPEYDERRKVILQLAESMPETAHLFHAQRAPGKVRAWLSLAGFGVLEVMKLPFRYVAGFIVW